MAVDVGIVLASGRSEVCLCMWCDVTSNHKANMVQLTNDISHIYLAHPFKDLLSKKSLECKISQNLFTHLVFVQGIF